MKDGLRFLKIILDSALVYFPLSFWQGLCPGMPEAPTTRIRAMKGQD